MTPLIVLTLLAQAPAPAGGVGFRERLACAPMNAPAPPVDGMRVSGSATHGRIMFGPGDTVVVNAGLQQGVQKGQIYYVRRHVRDNFKAVAQSKLEQMNPGCKEVCEILVCHITNTGHQVRIECAGDGLRQLGRFHRVD